MVVDEPDRIGHDHYREYLYDMLRELAVIASRCREDLTAQLLLVLVANANPPLLPAKLAGDIPIYVDVPLEANRLAALLKVAANTARMIKDAGSRTLDGERVSRVATGIDLLANELDEVSRLVGEIES